MNKAAVLQPAVVVCLVLVGCFMSDLVCAAAIKVEIRGGPGHYQLIRAGEPYDVRGAGAISNLESLAKHGGNSIRTWGVDEKILDAAHALGLTVSLCLDIARQRHGFDYDDNAVVRAQFLKAKAVVQKYKDHPALLTWVIGNELNYDYSNPKVYDAVNQISKMIHELDPNHPTTTTTASISKSLYGVIRERAPDLDFLSVQVYQELFDLPLILRNIGIDIPIMVTEWGTVGHWEVSTTDWNAPLEPTSSQKARNYLNGYQQILDPLRGQVIGSYAFVWGQKQERTPTWYGTFTESGDETESIDALHFAWTGTWPENRTPGVNGISLNGQDAVESIVLKPGDGYAATISVSDHEDDELKYRWLVLRESVSRALGGDTETIPEELHGLIEQPAQETIMLTAPEETGAYRLFVYVQDVAGRVAHANIPFYVSSNTEIK